jgi:hypothetical protein
MHQYLFVGTLVTLGAFWQNVCVCVCVCVGTW